MPLRQLRPLCLVGLATVLAAGSGALQPALAGPQLDALVAGVNPCIAVGKPQACPAGVAALQRLRQAAAYGRADQDCREQVTQLDRVLALLPIRDVIDQTVQASLDGLVQACAASGRGLGRLRCRCGAGRGDRFPVKLSRQSLTLKAAAKTCGDGRHILCRIAKAAGATG